MTSNIYPAIDIIDGKCVRLTKGDYNTSITYHDDPLEMALQFEKQGADYLHIVDLDAAKNPDRNNRLLIGQIIRESNLKVQTGGGVRTENDLSDLLDFGAQRLIIGSAALNATHNVKAWGKKYGWDHVVIGADISSNKIAIHGWLNVSDRDVFDFIDDYLQAGATTFLITEISKDGMLSGSASDLYREIIGKFKGIKVIASGGVHNMEEVDTLSKMGVESIIIGKAIYEDRIDIKSLFVQNNNQYELD